MLARLDYSGVVGPDRIAKDFRNSFETEVIDHIKFDKDEKGKYFGLVSFHYVNSNGNKAIADALLKKHRK